MKLSAHQLSLFLVAVSASSSAIASTCTVGNYDPANGSACVPAPLGSYVPTAGATAAMQASPGYFVNSMGASQQTPAPAGYYVPTSGATAATQASPGYYVPTSGASAQIAAAQGFYTATSGATDQIPAGGMAAPLTAALQTSELFSSMSADLIDAPSSSRVKLAAAYQRSTVDQDGSPGRFDTDIAAATLQMNVDQRSEGESGLQLSYGHHDLEKSGTVRNDGDSFELGAFHSGSLFAGRYKAFLVYGQTDYDNRRHVVINDVSGLRRETLGSNGKVAWYGLRSQATYPLAERVNALGQLGVLRYATDNEAETGTATLNGAPAASVAGLNASDMNYVALPAMVGLSFDVMRKEPQQRIAPVTLEAGVTGNLSGEQDIRVTSQSVSGYSFDLPVTQTSAFAGLVGLKLNAWDVGGGFNVSGSVQGQLGPDSSALQAGVELVKRW